MRINTKDSIALGAKIHDRFGSWAEARSAARIVDGSYVLPSAKPAPSKKPEAVKS